MRPLIATAVLLFAGMLRADEPANCDKEQAHVDNEERHFMTVRRPDGTEERRPIKQEWYDRALADLKECKERLAASGACNDKRGARAVLSLAICVAQSEIRSAIAENKLRHEAIARARRTLNAAAFESLGCVNVRAGRRVVCLPMDDTETKADEEEIARDRELLASLGFKPAACTDPDVKWLASCGKDAPQEARICDDAKRRPLREAEERWGEGGACRSR
jgi:hypothetical protein